MKKNHGTVVGLLVGAACLLAASSAWAYPTAVIFAPTGDTKTLGDVSALVYTSLYSSPKGGISGSQEKVSGGSSWTGVVFGVVPKFDYASGLSFGGLEIGADLISPVTTSTAGEYKVKPVFNAKANLLAESGNLIPHVGVGMMQLSTMSHQSLNLGYLSLTRTLTIGGTSYGRFTLGLANSFAKATQRYGACGANSTAPEDVCTFRGTAPFRDSKSLALLGGYESPMFGPVYLAIDHVGGNSEVSSTNVAINLQLAEGTYLAAGAFFGNERRRDVLGTDPYDGYFFYLSSTGNLLKLFKAAEPKAADPVTAPASRNGPSGHVASGPSSVGFF